MFEHLRDQLADCARRPDIFFRDDDADRDLPELRRLLDLFGSRGLSLNLAVIPGTLSPAAASLLRACADESWLELHQHGWMHINHEPQGRKCEFGPSRPVEQQRADIERGKQVLAHLLDGRCVPIFTPPWNRCTATTCQVLEELEFTAFSKDRSPHIPGCNIAEASISVDIFTWKSGAKLNSAAAIEADILSSLASPEPVGILLHHKMMPPEAFALVESLVDAIAPVTRFHSLEAICRKCN